jgi:hypothetical protein
MLHAQELCMPRMHQSRRLGVAHHTSLVTSDSHHGIALDPLLLFIESPLAGLGSADEEEPGLGSDFSPRPAFPCAVAIPSIPTTNLRLLPTGAFHPVPLGLLCVYLICFRVILNCYVARRFRGSFCSRTRSPGSTPAETRTAEINSIFSHSLAAIWV